MNNHICLFNTQQKRYLHTIDTPRKSQAAETRSFDDTAELGNSYDPPSPLTAGEASPSRIFRRIYGDASPSRIFKYVYGDSTSGELARGSEPKLEGIKLSRQALKGYRAAAFQVSVIGSLPGANGPVMVESVRTFLRKDASNLMKLQAPQPRDENGRFASKDSFNPVTDQYFVVGDHLVESSFSDMQEPGILDESESIAPWLTVKHKDSGELEILGMKGQKEQLPAFIWTRRTDPGSNLSIPPSDDQRMLLARDTANSLMGDPEMTFEIASKLMNKVGQALANDTVLQEHSLSGIMETSSPDGNKRYLNNAGRVTAVMHNGRSWEEVSTTKGEREAFLADIEAAKRLRFSTPS